MTVFKINNMSMDPDAFPILCGAMKRVFGLRKVGLAEGNEGGSSADRVLNVSVDPELKSGRYVITFGKNGTDIRASDTAAVFAGAGRFMLECVFDGRGSFEPPAAGTVIDFTPEKPLRGMYFATHFYNFYHVAPIVEVYEVIEDLAMRGCNNILVWFDLHHYDSMNDPEARQMAERLRMILKYANRIGIGGSLTMLSNEAFRSSPEELRAEWRPLGRYHHQPVDHYHIEICPSKPGGIEEILRTRREMLSYFTDLDIDYVVYWPYDQGGCTCEKCQPWGSNGFVRLFPHFRNLVAEMMPKTKVIVSTWFFDKFVDGEWDEFYPQMTSGVFRDVPYFMSFFFNGKRPACLAEKGIPEGVEFIDFPEISMYSCNPWGGFGASVLTRFLERTNAVCASMYQGGFPYSEGIFEDANKFIQLASFTGLYPNAHDALRAYVRSEFCCADEELYEAVERTETALARQKFYDRESYYVQIADTSDVDFVYETFEKYNKILPENITRSRNFRLFYLRAVIDKEIRDCEGFPIRSERCQEAMKEVNAIYHVTADTKRWVSAPVGK